MRSIFILLALAVALCAPLSATEPTTLEKAALSLAQAPEEGPMKVAFAFKDGEKCQMALTVDSVAVLPWDSSAGALEPDDESDGLEHALRKRALSSPEKDSAAQLLGITRTFKGVKRFECPREDGYGFSLWSDSLTLHCRNCFSCTEGVSMSEARTLARLGRLSLWLYRMRDGLNP
jgi:hypothetical protein